MKKHLPKIKEFSKKAIGKMIMTTLVVLTVGGTIWAIAAFTEPTSGPAASVQDFAKNIMGANNNNNAFDSGSVVANNDGSIVERSEFVGNQIGTTTGTPVSGVPSPSIQDIDGSLTANGGMYSNRIILMTPPAAYTEVCFKNGTTTYDIHAASASTSGGNCVPGDIGYVIEKNERTASSWKLAKQTCLQNGMRLTEPFEWGLACTNAATWSLTAMTGNWEWASNFSLPFIVYDGIYYNGVGSAIFGGTSCSYAGFDAVGNYYGNEASYVFRCAR